MASKRVPDLDPPLSTEALKELFYSHLKKHKVVPSLKAQLRSSLVQALYQVVEPVNSAVSTEENGNLAFQISNWIICQHLEQFNFQYTLSTFITEYGSGSPLQMFSLQDIFSLCKIPASTSSFLSILSNNSQNQSILYNVFRTCLLASYREMHDSSMQTENNFSSNRTDLESPKENVHETKTTSALTQLNFILKLLKMDFKSMVLKKSKDKLDSLRNSEGYQNLVEANRDQAYLLLFEEMFKEVDEMCIKNEQENEQISSREKKLIEKELTVEKTKVSVQHQAQMLAKKEAILDKIVEQQISFLQNDPVKMPELQENVQNKGRDEFKKSILEMKTQIRDLEERIVLTTAKNEELSTENFNLLENIKKLKLKLKETREELEVTKARFKQSEENLHSQIIQPLHYPTFTSGENANLLDEFEKMKNKYRLNEAVWSDERIRLKAESEHNKQLKELNNLRMEQLEKENRDLNANLQEMRSQLMKFQTLCHEEAIEATKLLSAVGGNYSNVTYPSFSKLLPKGSLADFEMSLPSNLSPQDKENRLNFISEAKKRIQNLQSEAEVLSQKCGYYLQSPPMTWASPTPNRYSPIIESASKRFSMLMNLDERLNSTYSRIPTEFLNSSPIGRFHKDLHRDSSQSSHRSKCSSSSSSTPIYKSSPDNAKLNKSASDNSGSKQKSQNSSHDGSVKNHSPIDVLPKTLVNGTVVVSKNATTNGHATENDGENFFLPKTVAMEHTTDPVNVQNKDLTSKTQFSNPVGTLAASKPAVDLDSAWKIQTGNPILGNLLDSRRKSISILSSVGLKDKQELPQQTESTKKCEESTSNESKEHAQTRRELFPTANKKNSQEQKENKPDSSDDATDLNLSVGSVAQVSEEDKW